MNDVMVPFVDHLERRLDVIEEDLLSTPTDATRQDLYRLQRDVIQLRRAVVPQAEVIRRLGRESVGLIEEADQALFRDVYDHLYRMAELSDSYRQLLDSAMDSYRSSQDDELNDMLRILTILSALIMPVTMIAGIYGMNFQYMPELSWRPAYFVVLGVSMMIVIAMAVVVPPPRLDRPRGRARGATTPQRPRDRAGGARAGLGAEDPGLGRPGRGARRGAHRPARRPAPLATRTTRWYPHADSRRVLPRGAFWCPPPAPHLAPGSGRCTRHVLHAPTPPERDPDGFALRDLRQGPLVRQAGQPLAPALEPSVEPEHPAPQGAQGRSHAARRRLHVLHQGREGPASPGHVALTHHPAFT